MRSITWPRRPSTRSGGNGISTRRHVPSQVTETTSTGIGISGASPATSRSLLFRDATGSLFPASPLRCGKDSPMATDDLTHFVFVDFENVPNVDLTSIGDKAVM